MNMISFLTEHDLPSAFHIESISNEFPWSEKNFTSNQGERYLNLKIEQQGRLVGYAITQRILDEATLFNIAIAPDFQRQGLARQLLTHLIMLLQQEQVQTLWLEVRASNQRAIALYEQLGFNQVTVRNNYYPALNGREDAIIMALMIE